MAETSAQRRARLTRRKTRIRRRKDRQAKTNATHATKLAKDAWIQKAKALLFDVSLSHSPGGSLYDEAVELIDEGGGYDGKTESAKTPLRWPEAAA